MRKPLSNSEPIDMKLADKLIFLISLLTVLVGLTGLLYAAEPICPGGTSPRTDIKLCLDFDKLTNCITGFENQCKIDNGYTQGGSGWKITSSGGAAVGSGYTTTHPPGGGTGAGFQYVDPIPGGNTTTFNLRYYRRFRGGYVDFGGGHGPQVMGAGTGGCEEAIKFQMSLYSSVVYVPSPCGATSFFIFPNVSNPTLRNNHWDLIEIHVKNDTACTDPTAAHGCNGEFWLKINGSLVSNYTDINFGGVTNNMQWHALWAPLEYYHYEFPPWGSDQDYDNFAYSNTGTEIGAAANENARGTADASSPYFNFIGANAMTGRHPEGDCSANGYLGPYGSYQWRAGATLQSTIAHGLYVDHCSPPMNPDTAMQVSTGGGGGGFALSRTTIFPQYSNYGWIYLPSTNTTSFTRLILNGFISDLNFNYSPSYVGMSIHNGKWAVIQGVGNSFSYLDSTTNVTYDAWHEYEIMTWNDTTVTLMIDRTRVLNRVALPNSVAWLFNPALEGSRNVWGVIDYQPASGNPTFNAYIDDVGGGSVSWWSCDGWGAASCPFGGGGGGGSLPAVPTSLTIK